MDLIQYSSLQRLWIVSYSYYSSLFTPIELKCEHDLLGNCFANTFAMCILDAKYEQVNIQDVTFNQQLLLIDHWCNLFNIFLNTKKLFNGTLGVYPHKEVHIDLKPGAKLVHHNAYPVPHIHWQTFKKELNQMVELGILEFFWASKCVSLAFIIPKKDR